MKADFACLEPGPSAMQQDAREMLREHPRVLSRKLTKENQSLKRAPAGIPRPLEMTPQMELGKRSSRQILATLKSRQMPRRTILASARFRLFRFQRVGMQAAWTKASRKALPLAAFLETWSVPKILQELAGWTRMITSCVSELIGAAESGTCAK